MRDSKHSDKRGDKPAKGGKKGLEFPLGNAHWEQHPGDTMVADCRYSSEMGEPEDLKESVDKLAGYVRKHKMKY